MTARGSNSGCRLPRRGRSRGCCRGGRGVRRRRRGGPRRRARRPGSRQDPRMVRPVGGELRRHGDRLPVPPRGRNRYRTPQWWFLSCRASRRAFLRGWEVPHAALLVGGLSPEREDCHGREAFPRVCGRGPLGGASTWRRWRSRPGNPASGWLTAPRLSSSARPTTPLPRSDRSCTRLFATTSRLIEDARPQRPFYGCRMRISALSAPMPQGCPARSRRAGRPASRRGQGRCRRRASSPGG